MAVLVSTLMAYGRLSEDNEITAIKTSGINNISDYLSTVFLKQEALFPINKAIHEIHNPSSNK